MNYVSRTTTIWTMCKFSIPLLNCVVYQKYVFHNLFTQKLIKNDQKWPKNQRRRAAHIVLKYRQKHEKSVKDGPWTVLSTPPKKKLGYPCLTKRCVISRQKTCFFDIFSPMTLHDSTGVTVLKYRWNHEKAGKGCTWTALSTPPKKKLGYPCLTKRCVIFRQKTCFFYIFSWFCHFRTTCNFINIPWMDLFVGFCGTA